jgi:hypothetical protein
MLYAPVSFYYSVGPVAKIWSERIEGLLQDDSLFLYSTTLHPHIFMGASITDRTILTSDTKEFHFHKRDFDWLIYSLTRIKQLVDYFSAILEVIQLTNPPVRVIMHTQFS